MTAFILRRRGLGLSTLRSICRFSETGLRYVRNDNLERLHRLAATSDMVIRWGCTSRVPVRNVLNTSDAIHRVNNKAAFRRLMQEQGTELCPKTLFDYHSTRESNVRYVVVRPEVHYRGSDFYVVDKGDGGAGVALQQAFERAGDGAYATELINKTAEYRVFVAQGRVVWVARKVPRNSDEVVWNHHSGNCVFENTRWGQWPLQGVRKAVEAFNLSGLDFGGVDVIQDATGRCYVLEINSASTQDSDYRNSLIARVFDHIVRNGKEHIPLVQQRGGWRKFGHPAVSNEAIIPDN